MRSAPARAYRSIDSRSAGTPMTEISMEPGSRPFSTARRSSSARPPATCSAVTPNGSHPSPHEAILLKALGAMLPRIIGGMRLRSRLGEAVHWRKAVVPALVRALLLRPELLHRLHGLPSLGPASVEVDAEQLPLLTQTAYSDAEQKPPARVHVQRGHLFGKSNGIAGRGRRRPRCRASGWSSRPRRGPGL